MDNGDEPIGALVNMCPNGCDNSYERDGKKYSRIIGYEIRGVYDGVAFWMCPECGARWHRFDPPGRIHDAVEEFWKKMDEREG